MTESDYHAIVSYLGAASSQPYLQYAGAKPSLVTSAW